MDVVWIGIGNLKFQRGRLEDAEAGCLHFSAIQVPVGDVGMSDLQSGRFLSTNES